MDYTYPQQLVSVSGPSGIHYSLPYLAPTYIMGPENVSNYSSQASVPGTLLSDASIARETTEWSGPVWPDENAWENHKDIIRRLYVIEKKKLNNVISIMEQQYNFKATVNMYKKRIAKWGFDRRSKEHEMRAVLRKHTRRANVGKSSVFTIRDQHVDLENVMRFLRRKDISLEDVLEDRAPTPPSIRCMTPIHQIPSSPRPPIVFHASEQILILFRSYVDVLLERNPPRFYNPEYALGYKIDPTYGVNYQVLHVYYTAALHCFVKNTIVHNRKGHCLLERAFSKIKTILENDLPESWKDLLDTLYMLESLKATQLSAMLVKYFTSMAHIVLPRRHPTVEILMQIQHLQTEKLLHNIFPVIYRVMTGLFLDLLGYDAVLTQVVSWHQPPENRSPFIRGITAELYWVPPCEQNYDPKDLQFFGLSRALADLVIRQEPFKETDYFWLAYTRQIKHETAEFMERISPDWPV